MEKRNIERSPRYPYFSFKEAIEKVVELEKKEGKHYIPKEIAVKSWGYKSLHGRALSMIGALNHFGLIEQNKGNIKLSTDAITILKAPSNSPERKDAILRCALSPSIFQVIENKYGSQLPSRDTLKWDLHQLKYSDIAADTVIQVYSETKEYIEEECGCHQDETVLSPDNMKPTPSTNKSTEHNAVLLPSQAISWTFPLVSGTTATVSISGETISKCDLDLLIKFLEVCKTSLKDERDACDYK